MVELMNIPLTGSRLALAAAASPGDGSLDVLIVTEADRERLYAWAEAPDDSPCPIPTRRAAAARLTVEERPFRLDDRSPDETLSGTVQVRIRPGFVRILDPREA